MVHNGKKAAMNTQGTLGIRLIFWLTALDADGLSRSEARIAS
jgi:hypothetical protein